MDAALSSLITQQHCDWYVCHHYFSGSKCVSADQLIWIQLAFHTQLTIMKTNKIYAQTVNCQCRIVPKLFIVFLFFSLLSSLFFGTILYEISPDAHKKIILFRQKTYASIRDLTLAFGSRQFPVLLSQIVVYVRVYVLGPRKWTRKNVESIFYDRLLTYIA